MNIIKKINKSKVCKARYLYTSFRGDIKIYKKWFGMAYYLSYEENKLYFNSEEGILTQIKGTPYELIRKIEEIAEKEIYIR